MREIRKLSREHIDAYTEIAYNAYPSFKDFSREAMDDYKAVVLDILENDPQVTFYGLFEGEKLIAVMRLFDFQMNCFGKVVPVSGLGFLGVHLMHKKEKAAKTMVQFYEEVYRKQGIPIASLLPFRPDFYKRMGYGMGTKMNQYRIATQRIPAFREGSDLRYITRRDLEELLACHSRVVEKNHGMMMKFGDEIRDLKGDAANRIVGSYRGDGTLSGYLVYKFQNGRAGNYTQNNIYIKELIYEDTQTLKKLLGYLRRQEDQVQLVIFNTEDENFHYLFDNPTNDVMSYIPYGYIESNIQAVGVMYKLLDIPAAFRQCAHRNYNGASITMGFVVEDEMEGRKTETIVCFEKGKARVCQGSDGQDIPQVTLETNTAHFTSLFLGSVSVQGLYRLGLIKLDREELLPEVDRAFYCSEKPVCYTDF